jgi:hypothetical protein
MEKTTFTYPTIKVTPAIHEQLFHELRTKKRFFTAVFVKKTGEQELRVYSPCKFGVKKYVNGKGLKFEPRKYGLTMVWVPACVDLENGDKGWRSLNLNTLMLIKYAGKTYQF